MKREWGSIGSARATRRSKRLAVAEKVNEPEAQLLVVSFANLPPPLPPEITQDILRRLPIKSIVICKYVCRSWKALISEPHFAKLHFQHAPTGLMIRARQINRVTIMYLLERESEMFKNEDGGQLCFCEDSYIKPDCNCHVKLEHKFKLPLNVDRTDETQKRSRSLSGKYEFAVVNSCNGLLCLSSPDRNYFVVCNPVTSEFIRLPESTRIRKPYTSWRDMGFGFQPKTNEYKVVTITSKQWRIIGVEIHTLGTSTWSDVKVYHRHVRLHGFPTCMSGTLHWINDYDKKSSILCFDFESESFHSFPCPPHLNVTYTTMGEYGGSLYICSSSTMRHFQMWIMKEYGLGESWTKVFSIDITSKPKAALCWPVKHFKNGAAIVMCCKGDSFIYYEPGKNGFKIFKVRGTWATFEAIPHIPSLVSLKDAVKGDNIEVMNVHSRCEELKLQEEKGVLLLAKVNELTNLCYEE